MIFIIIYTINILLINDYFIYLLNQDIIKEINKGKHIEDKFFDKNKVNKKIKLWGEKCQ